MTRISPRLLIVCQGIDGGISLLSSALALGLQRAGWQCSIAYVGRPGVSEWVDKDKAAGIQSRAFVTGKARSLKEIAMLLKSIGILSRDVHKEKPDAVVLAGFIPALLYAAPFKLLGVRHVVFWNHSPQNTFLRLKKILFPLALRGIDYTVCVSASTASSLTKHFGISPDRISVIPNGIDPRRWQSLPSTTDFERLRVLMPLRCDLNQKDPLTLIKAVALLRRRGVDIELTLVGSGVHADLVQDAIRAEGQGPALRLLAPTPDIPALMAQNNVMCLSTKFEGLPTVVIEGMLARRAVVASRVEGCIDVIRDNENGFLFEAGSVDDCAAKLDALRTHPHLLAIIGQAYDEALATYTPSSMVEKFASLLSNSGSRSGI